MTSPAKGQADFYAEGDWNAQCDQCGRKRKGSTLVPTWNGLMVCPDHGSAVIQRQPQDFVRGIPDNQTPPFTRPQSTEIFVFDTLDAEDGGTLLIPDDFLLTETNDPILLES